MGDFTTNCPLCQAPLLASSDIIGQNVQCPSCQTVFAVTAPAMPQADTVDPKINLAPQQMDTQGPKINRPFQQMNTQDPKINPPFQQMNTQGPKINRPFQQMNTQDPKINPPPPPQQKRTLINQNISQSTSQTSTPRPSYNDGGIFNAVSSFTAVAALLVAIAALVFNIFFTGPVKVRFQKTPEDTVKEYFRVLFELKKQLDYDWRKNGAEILNSLEIIDVRNNGNFSVVFYKMSRGAMSCHDAIWLKKNKDEYWVLSNDSDAKKEISEYWISDVKSRIKSWRHKNDDPIDKLVE